MTSDCVLVDLTFCVPCCLCLCADRDMDDFVGNPNEAPLGEKRRMDSSRGSDDSSSRDRYDDGQSYEKRRRD